MKIFLIRHGKTAGNLEKRYIGRTDEPLCPEGIAELKNRGYPECEAVVCSPMKRCLETAALIYPGKSPIVCADLRECDFGKFEGKNYLELSADPDYQKWVDSGGMLPFPDGESPEAFQRRCQEAFLRTVSETKARTLSLVVHGGTIMAVLERFAVPKRGFYDSGAKNGGGFLTEFDGAKITILGELE